MPKLLSSICPGARAQLSFNYPPPEISQVVCNVFSLAASIDYELHFLIARLVGVEIKPAIAMLEALRSKGIQKNAWTAAAKSVLSDDEYAVFKAVVAATEKAKQERNNIAHFCRVKCDRLPYALLLISPEHLRSREIECERIAKIGFQRAGHPIVGEEFNAMWEPDTDKVLVYDIKELAEICDQLFGALSALLHFRWYLNPSKYSHAFTEFNLSSREDVFSQMMNISLFRDCYAKAR